MAEAKIEEVERVLKGLLHEWNVTHGLARSVRSALKEIELFRNHAESRAANFDGVPVQTRVQIGGGAHRLPGFFNIDIVPPTDLIWDVREGIPLPSGTTEFVFSEHFLEHIDYPTSVKNYVAEVHRILVEGGQVVTGVPDGDVVLRGYYERDLGLLSEMRERWFGRRDNFHCDTYIDLVNYVFRDQDDSAKYTPHLWAYDFDKLVSLFEEAGFRHVERWPFDPSIANPDREWASLYVRAIK
ncbi:class I SAM-dependent methyltransferase [Saccharopolyspora hattusasensis]|uniref:class I SAM-dependent methyltransferase n=1 Tax=Saccharopolyspora hattusasensis TaxID=1128679 RepID=UPI003D9625DF